jgi:predicted DNA-binding protein (MmcQ/YjbR family)
MLKDSIFAYIKKKYSVLPEYPWKKYDSYAVFRHVDNNKWFALMMDISREKLGLSGTDCVSVINLKIADRFFKEMLQQQEGIMPAYHMNKQHWITVLLDGTVEETQVCNLIDSSFLATASANAKVRSNE